MFSKILIANRGEIACRVMHTAKAMGIRTVAIYSDADAQAMHVALADEAVHIGPAPVADSYLMADRIIDAALRTGAQAIHPGYGFLSENPDFVDAVNAAGLVFIGPTADAIRAMGLKDAAKALMAEAGVPVVPGYHGENQDPAFLKAEAQKIGFPVLIKARAGGGGKGMRLVETPDSFDAQLESAAREAQNSFGDPHVLIEKYILSPRHIEVQVFGDSHGNVVHLYERDCSLQRRHQKVIEEAPAPGMTAAVRTAMTDAAVRAAKAIGYENAGTIEFIADGSGDLRADGFWFMEMNTRLQVEHPVTEAVTGTDLVAWQLRVAAGEALPLAQSDIPLQGHAFEARIYAEDPANGFLPVTGQIDHLTFGKARIDTGVQAGDQISSYYDPMIAKLTTHGQSRGEALNALSVALAETHIVGTTTNADFLQALSLHEGFAKGEVDTGLIGRDLDDLVAQTSPDGLIAALATLVLSGIDLSAERVGWRLWGPATLQQTLIYDGSPIEVALSINQPGTVTVSLQDDTIALTDVQVSDGQISATHDGHHINASFVTSDKGTHSKAHILHDGQRFAFRKNNPLAVDVLVAGSRGDVVAPMSGVVRDVHASAGQTVTQGEPLIVLEAMKMEHVLAAPRDGTVAEVACKTGDQVQDAAMLLRLEDTDDG